MSIALPASAASFSGGAGTSQTGFGGAGGSGGSTSTSKTGANTSTTSTNTANTKTGGAAGNAGTTAGSAISSVPNLTNSTTSQVVGGGADPFSQSANNSQSSGNSHSGNKGQSSNTSRSNNSRNTSSVQDVTYRTRTVKPGLCGRDVKKCWETDGYVRDFSDKNGRKGSFEGYTPFKIFSTTPPCHTPPKKIRCRNTKFWLESYYKPHTHFCHVVVSKCHRAPQHCKPKHKPFKHHPKPRRHKNGCGCGTHHTK